MIPTTDAIWAALEDVKDPEIPVVSVVGMGIVRAVSVEDERVVVTITPTFAGCPALAVMQDAIVDRLRQLGIARPEVRTVLSPPWTTEWLTEETRAQLKSFGLAPPPRHEGDFTLVLVDQVACPYCGSKDTSLRNSFGPTLCRAIFYCNACHQPFEQFKPL